MCERVDLLRINSSMKMTTFCLFKNISAAMATTKMETTFTTETSTESISKWETT
jgi:hypothetical protein